MKKAIVIAIAVVLSALCFTSCTKESGDVLYHVEVSFFDNMDICTSAFDKGFEDAGFTRVSTHYWKLNGEKNACNRKAKETFQARAKFLDENRDKSGVLGFALLGLKGEKVTLKYTFGSGEENVELATYTFVKED